ncbi:TetR/AcrR family transcriptional regulator [Paenibacillus tarimensis]|uniref:TetR/AcrR family transcriptional regulator n=1 Tax=Paenibacillus tarimensis TaxID=416012 RepID=UPI001F1B7FFB|nr:TetR/AcrR family transcriptional regulator [Paenibacillus tarimensis]MCF2945095.1 TetR/AcrR family transcriptional regulator [Paenibacillus tarimensis]
MIKNKKTTNRETVLRIAASLFLERGYHLTSMDDIVAASKVSKTNIYYHFKGKEDLLAAIVDDLIAKYNQAMADTAGRSDLPATERLIKLVKGLVDQSVTGLGGSPFVTLYTQAAQEAVMIREKIGEFFHSQMTLVENLLQEGVNNNELDPQLPVKEAAAMIIATIEGGLFLQHTDQNNDVVSQVLQGLAYAFK